ncbi:allophanate hydrolase subunit 1 [Parasphingorhabdus sp.]|uniref:5-oxoprolinase subunit B family protein n=1 Tax=Parasphingorhabdus sp. TaxID=2709688 RepID=UPI003593560E
MPENAPLIHICDDWISITLSDRESVLAAQAAFAASGGWTEIVPGMDSIAVQFDPCMLSPDDAARLTRHQLKSATSVNPESTTMVTIPVCYEGDLAPDLAFVAEKIGIETDAFRDWHTSRPQQVAMLGFMPGFAYLESPDPSPAIGRLADPRQLVHAGSVGIIGRQSCIYSFDSPGGWPIIGRTPLLLFDPAQEQPALLSAGQSVRFETISRQTFDQWPRTTAK